MTVFSPHVFSRGEQALSLSVFVLIYVYLGFFLYVLEHGAGLGEAFELKVLLLMITLNFQAIDILILKDLLWIF